MLAVGFVAAASLAGLVLTLIHRRQTAAVPERPWSAPGATPRLNAGRPSVPSGRAVAMALGRVEGRQFTASAWFAVGLAFSVLLVVLFGFVWAGENGGTRQGFVELMPWFAHPLVGMVVLAAYRATTRASRDGADELFDTCPAAPATRTAGFLLSAAVPVATLAVFLAVPATAVAFRSPLLHGALDADSFAEVSGPLVLGAGGVALGVALGRWVRFGLAPVITVVLIGFLATAVVNGSAPHGWKPLGQLSTAPPADVMSPVFSNPTAYWHLLWLAGLTALVGVLEGSAFHLAFASLGLPTEPDEDLFPMVIAVQARGVVALWLATRGSDAGATRSASTSDYPGSADAFERGSLQTGMCSVPPVVWSAQDLAAARAVLSLPDRQVARSSLTAGPAGPTPAPAPTSSWALWASRRSDRSTRSSPGRANRVERRYSPIRRAARRRWADRPGRPPRSCRAHRRPRRRPRDRRHGPR